MLVCALEADAAIVVEGWVEPVPDPHVPAEGTLSLPGEVFAWVGEAAAAGVTFEVLKSIAVGLARRGWSLDSQESATIDAGTVTATVRKYLQDCGFLAVTVEEVRKIDGEGWVLVGEADNRAFRAIADPDGRVLYVRVK